MGEWTRDVGVHLDRLRHAASVALRRPLRQGSDSSCHTDAMTTPRIHDIEFSELLHLEPHGPDTYVGIAARYPWGGRLFGGQVVAQALRAAALTVEADRPAHSLHSYFIRPGTTDEPIRYEVERLRDGRSFTTRQVVARQSGGAILNLSVSFQVVEEQADVSDGVVAGRAAVVRRPEPRRSLVGRVARAQGDVLRRQHHGVLDPTERRCGRRPRGPPVRDSPSCPMPRRHGRPACPTRTPLGTSAIASCSRGPASITRCGSSGRPIRRTWHWFDTRSHGLSGGRGLVTGDVVRIDGLHAATIAQEVLVRRLSEP